MRPTDATDWDGYVDRFHSSRPGITETIIAATRADGMTPYQWLAASVGGAPTVLDLACGSAPLVFPASATRAVGIDRSGAELATARSRHPEMPLVRGEAGRLPFRDRSVDCVACSMGLMVSRPLDQVVREITRVTRTGGALVLLLPARRPLSARDLSRYARLAIALRSSPARFPNPEAMDDISGLLEPVGYRVVRDERLRFSYPIADEAAAAAFVGSFYLPNVSGRRCAAARRIAERWIGTDIGIPLRRVSATAHR